MKLLLEDNFKVQCFLIFAKNLKPVQCHCSSFPTIITKTNFLRTLSQTGSFTLTKALVIFFKKFDLLYIYICLHDPSNIPIIHA